MITYYLAFFCGRKGWKRVIMFCFKIITLSSRIKMQIFHKKDALKTFLLFSTHLLYTCSLCKHHSFRKLCKNSFFISVDISCRRVSRTWYLYADLTGFQAVGSQSSILLVGHNLGSLVKYAYTYIESNYCNFFPLTLFLLTFFIRISATKRSSYKTCFFFVFFSLTFRF